MRRMTAVFALILIAALAGCADLSAHKKDEARDATLANYAATLRFGDIASAYQFVDPLVRAQHPLDEATKRHYAQVEVGDYNAQPPMATDANTIQQVVQISIIVKASQSAYDIVDHQTWHYDQAANRWWLESGLPDITPPQ